MGWGFGILMLLPLRLGHSIWFFCFVGHNLPLKISLLCFIYCNIKLEKLCFMVYKIQQDIALVRKHDAVFCGCLSAIVKLLCWFIVVCCG